ncbi:hypothetical protein KC19_6G155500 [Ceratodon purpureus]|uniref:Galactose oxidase n=1 Tax=Ceratodon purpureus TaxID=3225 RepID=A0A8T0HHN0_CERPU|nr:hypothetical protein KC19_6G155500 [Ceratodon purpureus]
MGLEMRKTCSIGLCQVLAALLLWWSAVLILCGGVNGQGSWETVVKNAGISTMHAAVTHFGNVVLLDRTNIGDSQLPLPPGVCRNNQQDRANKYDCTAHSALYSPGSNKIRPLFVQTDTWCSSGQFDGSGKLVQTGGDAEGVRKIRTYWPCADDGDCNWEETTTNLQVGRWYASNQQLPDGTQIVVGGRNAFTVEYVPANGRGQFDLQLLKDTNDAQNDNLYPFVHLLPDNNLFIFANRDSILYNWQDNYVVRKYPTIPGEPRNYPSAGSSVMLPLTATGGFKACEILVCGGAAPGSFSNPGRLAPASDTCGRMDPFAKDANWTMETMPQRRTMGDMILTPLGDVIIINGATKGSQGWGYASDPALTPVLYYPGAKSGERFQTLTGTDIPRMYHSTANLLPDGRILVAGSNTHQFYTFTGQFPTELRIEAFSPPYLGGTRPGLVVPGEMGYGEEFSGSVNYNGNLVWVDLSMASAPFVTHSYAMGQRLLRLGVAAPVGAGDGKWTIYSITPPSATIAPQGYYMMFAVVNNAPSWANWVKIG